jgi:hypothetical protein
MGGITTPVRTVTAGGGTTAGGNQGFAGPQASGDDQGEIARDQADLQADRADIARDQADLRADRMDARSDDGRDVRTDKGDFRNDRQDVRAARNAGQASAARVARNGGPAPGATARETVAPRSVAATNGAQRTQLQGRPATTHPSALTPTVMANNAAAENKKPPSTKVVHQAWYHWFW